MSEILKLEDKERYEIFSYTPIQTKFGKTYILEDDNLNKYWATSKVTKFINKINYKPIPGKRIFTIKTGNWRTFRKDGEEIKYLEMTIYE